MAPASGGQGVEARGDAAVRIQREVVDGDARAARVGGQHLPRLRVHPGRYRDRFPAGGAQGHESPLGQGRGPVVEGGVAHVHAGEFADAGLELEDVLEGPLADFRLIRRVCRGELAAGDERSDGCGDEMTVAAGAEERGGTGHPVGSGEGVGEAARLLLAQAGGQVGHGRVPEQAGYLGEEVPGARYPYDLEHVPPVLIAVHGVWHQDFIVTRSHFPHMLLRCWVCAARTTTARDTREVRYEEDLETQSGSFSRWRRSSGVRPTPAGQGPGAMPGREGRRHWSSSTSCCREICELLGGRIERLREGPATHFRLSVPKGPRGRVLT